MKNLLKNKQLWLCVSVSVLMVLVVLRMTSGYGGSEISVEAAPGAQDDISKMECKQECVPGMGEKSAYYTKSLSPCGLCGGQKAVAASAEYKILGGIGGSLLEK